MKPHLLLFVTILLIGCDTPVSMTQRPQKSDISQQPSKTEAPPATITELSSPKKKAQTTSPGADPVNSPIHPTTDKEPSPTAPLEVDSELAEAKLRCNKIFTKGFSKATPFLKPLGVSLGSKKIRAAARKKNRVRFFEGCHQLTHTERDCIGEKEQPFGAFRTCGVEGKLTFSFPTRIVTRFKKKKLGKVQADQLEQRILGTWSNDTPSWGLHESWTFQPDGTAIREVTTEKDGVTRESYKVSFPKQGRIGLKKKNSTQYIPFYMDSDSVYLIFNNAYDLHIIEKRDRFVLDTFQGYLFVSPGKCQLMTVTNLMIHEAECGWGSDENSSRFTFSYSSGDGKQSETWTQMGSFLLHPKLVKNRFKKEGHPT